ncbi:hypothetical protein [Bradyrhizobium forestalis]|uniref:hypothetical protein n=1 Tax=Bradyrhizobium forestalis TaxID=1419263 RepID=UPI0011AED126|nr:hypothetical protein [Bradyrhizobium forestalis]
MKLTSKAVPSARRQEPKRLPVKMIKSIMIYNCDDSRIKLKNMLGEKWEVKMEAARRFRAMALLCRQTAARQPERSWRLLAEAEYWEHLAAAALAQ